MHERKPEEIERINRHMGQMMKQLQLKINQWVHYFDDSTMAPQDPNLSFILDDISSAIEPRVEVETPIFTRDRRAAYASIGVLGARVWQGQRLSGVELGPDEMRKAGLIQTLQQIGLDVKDFGDIKPNQFPDDTYKHIQFPRTVGDACKQLSDRVQQIAREKRVTVILGGDHSIAAGTLHGYASVYPDLKVIWIDAHADLHTPDTTTSGNLHGCPMGLMTQELNRNNPMPGWDWHVKRIPARNLVYIGLRDVDPAELIFLKQYNIRYFTMKDLDEYGMKDVINMAVDYLTPMRDKPIAVQFDIDSLDPLHALTTGTAVDGGVTFREALLAMEELWKTKLVVAIDMLEVNVKLGNDFEARKTVVSANKILSVALGEARHGVVPAEGYARVNVR